MRRTVVSNRHLCRNVVCLLVGMLLAGTLCRAEAPTSAEMAKKYLPPEHSQMDIMELRTPPRLAELSTKLQLAMTKDPIWFAEQRRRAGPGRPTLYDERLGLTRAEWEEYLELSGRESLQKTGVIEVTAARDGSLVVFDSHGRIRDLDGVAVDLSTNEVRTPFGTAIVSERVDASSKQRITGPWNGIQWNVEKKDAAAHHANMVQFALGRLEDSNRGILYYLVEKSGGEKKDAEFFILLFDRAS